jgi:hypothetical protein
VRKACLFLDGFHIKSVFFPLLFSSVYPGKSNTKGGHKKGRFFLRGGEGEKKPRQKEFTDAGVTLIPGQKILGGGVAAENFPIFHQNFHRKIFHQERPKKRPYERKGFFSFRKRGGGEREGPSIQEKSVLSPICMWGWVGWSFP